MMEQQEYDPRRQAIMKLNELIKPLYGKHWTREKAQLVIDIVDDIIEAAYGDVEPQEGQQR
jgi:hypothetical protein